MWPYSMLARDKRPFFEFSAWKRSGGFPPTAVVAGCRTRAPPAVPEAAPSCPANQPQARTPSLSGNSRRPTARRTCWLPDGRTNTTDVSMCRSARPNGGLCQKRWVEAYHQAIPVGAALGAFHAPSNARISLCCARSGWSTAAHGSPGKRTWAVAR